MRDNIKKSWWRYDRFKYKDSRIGIVLKVVCTKYERYLEVYDKDTGRHHNLYSDELITPIKSESLLWDR